MAPEVALGLSYNESCDVYSFGIVLWQIMTLNAKAYGNSNRNNAIDFFVKSVWHGPQKRPSMVLKDPTVRRNFLPCLQTLVPACWNHDWQSRPTMEEVESILKDEVLHGTRIVNGDIKPHNDKTLCGGDCFETAGIHCRHPHHACKRPMPTKGPLALSGVILHRMGNLCQRTTKGVRMFPGMMSKQASIIPPNMDGDNKTTDHDQARRRCCHGQDLVSFSSSLSQRRRLTHQSRRSTFCLDINDFVKISRDTTEHTIYFSDYADDDDDEDENKTHVHHNDNHHEKI